MILADCLKKYHTDKSEIENKIPDTSDIVKKTDYNAKITEIEGKIPSVSGFATNSALAAVHNIIPNISKFVKKQIITQKLLKLNRSLLIIIMTSVSLLQSSIL